MNIVQPIRDKKVIAEIKEYLKDISERDYIIFLIGINTGLRMSDILPLRVSDVKGAYIEVQEENRHKPVINQELRIALNEYIEGKPDDEYLFTGRSKKRGTGLKNEPIGRSAVYKMLNIVAHRFGLTEIGTDTLSKTFGYHLYNDTQDKTEVIHILMKRFNHIRITATFRYIGLEDEFQNYYDRALMSFSLRVEANENKFRAADPR